ncbi:hypothetical protein SRIMM317S_01241 [Streptomyces rimosus subsp. rimosus]
MTERSAPAASATGPGTPARRTAVRAAATGTLAAALLGLAPQSALAATPAPPPAPAISAVTEARAAATAPGTLTTLSRFFARDGAVAAAKAQPRNRGADGTGVRVLARLRARQGRGPGLPGLEFLASTAVSADGQKASVWTARSRGAWKVVNIATGDGRPATARRRTAAPSSRSRRSTPGTSSAATASGHWTPRRARPSARAAPPSPRTRSGSPRRTATGLRPASAYDRRGEAGGYGPQEGTGSAAAAARPQPVAAGAAADDSSGPVTAASAVAGAAALLALGLSGAAALAGATAAEARPGDRPPPGPHRSGRARRPGPVPASAPRARGADAPAAPPAHAPAAARCHRPQDRVGGVASYPSSYRPKPGQIPDSPGVCSP